MRLLYHGTRYLNSILLDRRLRCGSIGDKHVSLTKRKSVARYWARIVRDDVVGFGYVITLDAELLARDGFKLIPFRSRAAQFDEHEVACTKDIKPLLRYVVAIERVDKSEVVAADIVRILGRRPRVRP